MTVDTRMARYGEELLEIDLATCARAVWQHRVRTLLMVVVGAVLVAGTTWRREPEYAATATLAVAHEENRPQQPTAAVYTPLAQDTTVAAEVIRALGLDRGLRTLTPDALGDRLTVSSSRDLSAMTIEARMWTPDLAADVANRMAEQVVARAAQIEAPSVAVLKAQTDAARTRFKSAADMLAAAGNEMGPGWTASLLLPPMEWSRDLSTPAAGRVRPELPRATADRGKYSAFVDAVGDYEVAVRVYVDVASAYEREVLRGETRTKTIQLVARAPKPDRPLPIHLTRSLALGALAGFVLAALSIAVQRAL